MGTSTWLTGVSRQVVRFPIFTVCIAAVLSGTLASYAAFQLGLNTDENDLFSAKLDFAERREAFFRNLPVLADPISVILTPRPEATSRQLLDAAEALAQALQREPQHFQAVYGHVSREFVDQHGLLLIEQAEVEPILERVEDAGPLLGALSQDPSLSGFLKVLMGLLDPSRDVPADALSLIEETGEVLSAFGRREPATLNWDQLGEVPQPVLDRMVLFVLPAVDYSQLDPAGPAVVRLREIIHTLPADMTTAVEFALTGVPVLAYDDGEHVAAQAGLAGIASLLLVCLVLLRGLGSLRLMVALMLTLVASLAGAAGLAALTVGHLNLISVAFGVLCIGLGVDFGIHYGLRFRELSSNPAPTAELLQQTSHDLFRPLLVCALTTGAAFLSFLPTGFTAMAELGLITAGGLLASLLSTLTLFPALLVLLAPPQGLPERSAQKTGKHRVGGNHSTSRGWARGGWTRGLALLIQAHPLPILAVFVPVTTIAVYFATQTRFDANPLTVRDPEAESVKVMEALLADHEALTWNLNVLVESQQEAAALKRRFADVAGVGLVRTPDAYLPDRQAERLRRIATTADKVLPGLDRAQDSPADARQTPQGRAIPPLSVLQLLGALRQQVELRLAAADSEPQPPFVSLRDGLTAALERLNEGENGEGATDDEKRSASEQDLEHRLFSGFADQVTQIRRLLTPVPMALETLPDELRGLAVASDQRLRVEIYPDEKLADFRAIERFVKAVLAVVPEAYGEALTIREISRVVLDAFAFAMLVSVGLLFVFVYAEFRNLWLTGLVVVPLAVATALTLAGCVLLEIPINFANVIALPLLLGIGVDTAVHLVHRARDLSPGEPLLMTSAARAAIFSGLTTIASFGTLALARHRGLSTLGTMLFLGVSTVLVCNLLLIPALHGLFGNKRPGARARS